MLPPLFIERLNKIIPAQHIGPVLETFDRKKGVSIRFNSLKADRRRVEDFLSVRDVSTASPAWYDAAWSLDGVDPSDVSRWEIVDSGEVYMQSLSSMLPVVVLDPQPGERVLDLCAAPGSKTSQMAAHMNNQGTIVAVEAIRERMYRLKSVLRLLDVRIVETKCLDGRRYRPDGDGLFDRILVDAPCSSEGRFKSFDKKSVGYWSLRKIREMVKKQRGLLLNACRMLKPGGALVYSTCTFAPEENEGVVSWVLRKMEGGVELEPVKVSGLETYPPVVEWEGKAFNPQVSHCCRILPSPKMEGFFMAQLVRI